MTDGTRPALAAVVRDINEGDAALIVAAEHIKGISLLQRGAFGVKKLTSVGQKAVGLNFYGAPRAVHSSLVGNNDGGSTREAVKLGKTRGKQQLTVLKANGVRIHFGRHRTRPKALEAIGLLI